MGVLDVAREPRGQMEAKTVFNTDEATIVDILGREEGLDEAACFPYLPT